MCRGAEEPERAGTEAGLKKQNTMTKMERGFEKFFLTTLNK
jgi:hypothetical protein